MSKKKVCVDAGHWFNTSGKRSCPLIKAVKHSFSSNKKINRSVKLPVGYQLKEHCANAAVAHYLSNILESRGYEVYRSGFTNDKDWKNDIGIDDPNKDVIARQNDIETKCCDISVSCHFNAYGDGVNFNSAQGYEVLIRDDDTLRKDSEALAKAVYSKIGKVVSWQKGRGIIEHTAGMCNAKKLNVDAAIICEFAFMTNQKECERIFTNPWCWYKYAVAVADGIDAYFAS